MNEGRPKCLHCDRPRGQGMFCDWHNCLELATCMVGAHWQTREELAGLYEKMATRTVDDLADFAKQHKAWLIYQLARRIIEVGGPRFKATVYNELKRRIAARRDNAPAPVRNPDDFVPPPTREPEETAATLGLEEPEYILGMES